MPNASAAKNRRKEAPKGAKVRTKTLAIWYFQLISGHVATGAYPWGKIPSANCRFCGREQPCYHFFVKCEAWAP